MHSVTLNLFLPNLYFYLRVHTASIDSYAFSSSMTYPKSYAILCRIKFFVKCHLFLKLFFVVKLNGKLAGFARSSLSHLDLIHASSEICKKSDYRKCHIQCEGKDKLYLELKFSGIKTIEYIIW